MWKFPGTLKVKRERAVRRGREAQADRQTYSLTRNQRACNQDDHFVVPLVVVYVPLVELDQGEQHDYQL
jgi:hypothetical protein